MIHKMRFAVATFAALLLVLSTAMIVSGHITLAYNNKFTMVFSNTGNKQECGNSCTVTSFFSSSGLTTPSPSPSPSPFATPTPTTATSTPSQTPTRLSKIINSCSPTFTRLSIPPMLYSSNIECIIHVIMTGETDAGVIEPYTYWSAYGVQVSNLSPTDVLHLNAQAEVTNPWQFNVQVDGAFANGSTYGGNTFNLVGLPNIGQNLTPAMHHMVVARQAWVTGLTGTVFFSFVLEAASTDMTASQNSLVLEKGDGGIQVAVFKS
jgi:hypothetical protein